ncbi:ABC transporter ATP-binding protein [Scopulibacillus cellulosilyticus]|uniref:ATP-binding cassette domain-containing protein n=1 Tax=Scopulibacillus cellulosilyticus TaxID=2665665 RepID=A0ABW2Q0X5_9BACL
MAVLYVDQLSKSISSNTLKLLSNVTTSIEKPAIIFILGASGQGKSTLLRILGRLESPDSGHIYLHGKMEKDWSPSEWRMKVGYVGQQPVMLPGTVEDNLRIVSRLHRSTFNSMYVKQLLSDVGLSYLDWNKQASLLSGGEKQRLALIRTILLNPDILLLDEVTSSLDIHSTQLVEEFIKSCHYEKEMTIISVTHNVKQAQNIGQRIWLLSEGRLIEDTDPQSLFKSPETDLSKSLMQQSFSKSSNQIEVFV